jgi:hypothetical protein
MQIADAARRSLFGMDDNAVVSLYRALLLVNVMVDDRHKHDCET